MCRATMHPSVEKTTLRRRARLIHCRIGTQLYTMYIGIIINIVRLTWLLPIGGSVSRR